MDGSMQNIFTLFAAFAALSINAAASPANMSKASVPVMPGDGVEIVPVAQSALMANVPRAPLVKENDESWFAGEPVWSGQAKDISAKFWMATTTGSFLFRIVVSGPIHGNSFHERNLWRGDCIYLSLNSRNDATEEDLKSGTFAPDDATYVFGAGSNGPEGRAVNHGNPVELTLDQTALVRGIKRDEKNQTVTYDIAIPFEKVSTAFGQSDAAAVALIIAHKNQDKQDLKWGRTSPDGAAPRQLFPIALGSGSEPFATIAPRITRLAAGQPAAEVTVALRWLDEGSVSWKLGDKSGSLQVSGAVPVRRYVVRVPAEEIRPGAADLVVEGGMAKAAVPAHLTCRLSTPAVVMDRFRRHIEKLLAAAPDSNEIVRDHLGSTLRVVRDAFDRLPLEQKEHPERAGEFMDRVELIDGKLPADRLDFDAHVRRGMPFVFAFVSEADRTLQFYSLQLPYAYDPAKAYPLTIYLHGMGDQNPLGVLGTSFDNSHQDTLFRTTEIDPSAVPPSHRGFVLAPWARGNSMYRGNGEQDVWQSMDIVRKRFKIDPDRVYLAGFSMGCGGTAGIAGRRPDVWAGINLASGFGDWADSSLPYLYENLRGMPMALWIGELDQMADKARSVHELLMKKGIEHRFEIVPQLPHTYPYDEFQKNVGYLMGFARKRPAGFTYVADNNDHAGRNGIFMNVPRHLSTDKLPTFTCSVTGKTVTITSQNTAGLSVDPAELGLDGPIEIFWNGEKAYSGPAKTVEIGEAPWVMDRK